MAASASERYADALRAASALARRDLHAVLPKLDLAHPVECKEALLEVLPALVDKYGAMAAAAAAEFYEDEHASVVGGAYRAQLAPRLDPEAVRVKLRRALRHLFEEGDDGEDG